jgi:hypothetical protein
MTCVQKPCKLCFGQLAVFTDEALQPKTEGSPKP